MHWTFPDGVTYLNHGSFGPPPEPVRAARAEWLARLASNPMDFFVRHLGDYLNEAAEQLAEFLHASASRLVFVPNATTGMNAVARSVTLTAGDEVLLTDHEYGAVARIWDQTCRKVGARTVRARLPVPLSDQNGIIDAVFEAVSPRTRLIVVSHITSPTAAILPVQAICERTRDQGLSVCIDGPHAPGMIDVDLGRLPCDYYVASCHKWLSAPFGSGFLYVSPRRQAEIAPAVVSWGRNLRGAPPTWRDEFHWPGTFDPTPPLCVPTALEFLKHFGLQRFRETTHALAQNARRRLLEIPGSWPLTDDDAGQYGSMVAVRIGPDPEGHPSQPHPLQIWLREKHRIEVPVVRWQGELLLRVSCHLYNSERDVESLVSRVKEWLDTSSREGP